jgi:hypothetical protein
MDFSCPNIQEDNRFVTKQIQEQTLGLIKNLISDASASLKDPLLGSDYSECLLDDARDISKVLVLVQNGKFTEAKKTISKMRMFAREDVPLELIATIDRNIPSSPEVEKLYRLISAIVDPDLSQLGQEEKELCENIVAWCKANPT